MRVPRTSILDALPSRWFNRWERVLQALRRLKHQDEAQFLKKAAESCIEQVLENQAVHIRLLQQDHRAAMKEASKEAKLRQQNAITNAKEEMKKEMTEKLNKLQKDYQGLLQQCQAMKACLNKGRANLELQKTDQQQKYTVAQLASQLLTTKSDKEAIIKRLGNTVIDRDKARSSASAHLLQVSRLTTENRQLDRKVLELQESLRKEKEGARKDRLHLQKTRRRLGEMKREEKGALQKVEQIRRSLQAKTPAPETAPQQKTTVPTKASNSPSKPPQPPPPQFSDPLVEEKEGPAVDVGQMEVDAETPQTPGRNMPDLFAWTEEEEGLDLSLE
jgi:hypothetical protein